MVPQQQTRTNERSQIQQERGMKGHVIQMLNSKLNDKKYNNKRDTKISQSL